MTREKEKETIQRIDVQVIKTIKVENEGILNLFPHDDFRNYIPKDDGLFVA